jgi:signal transduction histidine kinase
MDSVLLHDVRNIEFRLNMLLSNLEEHYEDPDFKRSVVDVLHSTVERLDSIIGRWAAHKESILIKVSLDVNGLLRELAHRATRRGGRVGEKDSRRPELGLALGSVAPIWADPYFLRDALASLIDNALEAAGPGGRVLVRSLTRRFRGRASTIIEIIDNGCGMSAEFLRDHLFHPFETTKPDGVGLGLYTANRIVRHHRGTMRIRSEPGQGTVVRLSFPAAQV